MYIDTHILSYYELFLYVNVCLSVLLDSLMFIYIYILSYYKPFLYFNLCLNVIFDNLSCTFTSISVLTNCLHRQLFLNLRGKASVYCYVTKYISIYLGHCSKQQTDKSLLVAILFNLQTRSILHGL